MALTARNALSSIERALRAAIRRNLGKPLPAVATIAALRAATTRGASGALTVDDESSRHVTSAGVRYEFNPRSTAADDGDETIAPTDSPTAGRWEKTTSTTSTGYLRDVILYDGGYTTEALDAILGGKRPSVVIHFDGADNPTASTIPGALYRYRPRFEVWALSQSMRRAYEGKLEPPISAEAAADPGVHQVVGDLKALLAGSDLDLDGLDYLQIGAEEMIESGENQRRFTCSLHLTALASYSIEDVPAAEAITSVVSQRQVTNLGADDEHDHDNYRVSGILAPRTAVGLTHSISAGTAYIDGVLVIYAGEAHTFGANEDTYRDLADDGTLAFTAVPAGAEAPEAASGTLRIGKTTTDDADIVSDALYASSLADIDSLGDPDTIDPTE